MTKSLSMISLFETFIRDTVSGKRHKLNGQKIKPQTVETYRETLKLLREYETKTRQPILVKTNIRNNQRLVLQEKKHWDKFYREFSRFLFRSKGCHDNYCGHVFKIIKCFFRYMKNEKFIALPEYYDRFYVRKEQIRIITLLPERLVFLALDKDFNDNLGSRLRRWKDVFVFGCISALRFSDLLNIRVRDIEIRGNDYFLDYRSIKTGTMAKVKLPPFAEEIFKKYSRRRKSPSARLFPVISLQCFNKNIRQIGLLAGWTEPIGKFRAVDGEEHELKKNNLHYCFCDLLTSHAMRRTGITILLMLGMPEYLVRRISGHTRNSESFSRSVNFSQSYITDEINNVHRQLLNPCNKNGGV